MSESHDELCTEEIKDRDAVRERPGGSADSENPPESPGTPGSRNSLNSARESGAGKGRSARFPGVFWNVVLQSCVPVVIILVTLVDWLVATLSLGHPPRPSLDDPKTIQALVSTGLYPATLFLFLAAPGSLLIALIAAPIAFLRLVRREDLLLQVKLLPLLLPLATWTVLIALVAFDPMRIFAWLAD